MKFKDKEIQSDIVNAEPFLPRDTSSIWTECLKQRDRIAALFEAEAAAWKVRGLIQRSGDVVFPAWVSFEAWVPKTKNSDATHRVLLKVGILPKPYSWFEFEYSVACISGVKSEELGPFVSYSDWPHWLRYMLGHASRPSVTLVQNFPWQVWRETNGVKILSPDWRKLAWIVGAGVPLALGSLGELMLGASGAAVLLLLAAVASLIVGMLPSNDPILHVNVGRPPNEPRILRYVDSWQTIISSLGSKADSAAERLQTILTRDGAGQGIRVAIEQISYVTPDGRQERQQLVLSQGRGIVFCHIYAYGEDLFIGWDAHANKGQWREKRVGSGWNRVLSGRVIVNSVMPSIQNITEYDIIDLNSLIEWTHARFVALIKKMVAENKLDQEIDFKIIRGTRQSLIAAPQAEEVQS